MSGVHSSPSRWVWATLNGYYRSAVLLAVAGLVPGITIAVAIFGLSFSRSWSAHLAAPQLVRLVAAVGEWAMAAVWAVERVRPEHDRARCSNDPVPASPRRPLARR